VPDTHKGFLQHLFGQFAPAHAAQGYGKQALAGLTIEGFKGATVAQRALGKQLSELIDIDC
jgi:hypothetical protein